MMQVRFRSDRAYESPEQAQSRAAKAREHQQELQRQIEEKRRQKVSTSSQEAPAAFDLSQEANDTDEDKQKHSLASGKAPSYGQ